MALCKEICDYYCCSLMFPETFLVRCPNRMANLIIKYLCDAIYTGYFIIALIWKCYVIILVVVFLLGAWSILKISLSLCSLLLYRVLILRYSMVKRRISFDAAI